MGPPSEPEKPQDVAVAAAEHIRFRHPDRTSENLARIVQRVPPGVSSALSQLLTESPDPDSALNLFDRLIEAADTELIRLLNRHRFLIHYALVVFGYSRFLGDTLISNPDLLHNLMRERQLDRSFSREEFHESYARFRARWLNPRPASVGQAGGADLEPVSLLLARFKRREYVRIMLRDVLGIAPLAETTAEISALADVLIEEALREAETVMRRRFGEALRRDAQARTVPTPFAVVSLGKLGGNELNYSSDVDLLFLYGDGDEPESATISNKEYFVRLAQLLSATLSRITAEGRIFRIDLRLRPQGGEGEPAIALGQALRYYAQAAQDWEKQALIKLRYTAGDAVLAREFIRGVQPHVYQTHVDQTHVHQINASRLNFAAIETALNARERISARRSAALGSRRIDVKLDRGGVRDIEFLVQCLQRVYGGAEPWLRSGGTLFSLQKLHDKGHITGKEFHELTNAYEFLRKVEHRLQLRDGQQTHRLPEAQDELSVVYRMFLTDLSTRISSDRRGADGQQQEGDDHGSEVLLGLLRERMAAVAEIYERVIYHQQIHHRQLHQAGDDSEFRLRSRVEDSGPEQPYEHLLQRLAEDCPPIYAMAMRSDLDPVTRRNLYRFCSAAFTSSQRYAALVRSPDAIARAVTLLGTSDFLSDILIRHPEEISTLSASENIPDSPSHTKADTPNLDDRNPLRSEKSASSRARSSLFESQPWAEAGDDPTFEYLAASDAPYGEKLGLLRRYHRHRIFASGARDILELRGVYDSLRDTTAAAEDAIRAAFAIAGKPHGLAVMALGRLGTWEFDLLSDADLLFVRDVALPPEVAAKSAGQIVQVLAAYTREGTLFPVDARLRPRGSEGDLVVTAAELQRYFLQEAEPWEALTYTKLRQIAGSAEAGKQAIAAREQLGKRYGQEAGFTEAVRDMRRRLETAESGELNFKTAPGAVYDIDFLLGYLSLRHGVTTPGNLRQRLTQMKHAIPDADFAVLDASAELMRTVEHVVRLVVGKTRKTLPGTEHARRMTERMVGRILRQEFAGGLERELVRTFAVVREIYDRVVR